MACSEANHLGNPVTLPLRGAGALVENSVYGARRARVSGYIAAHEGAMRAERFAGAVTAELLERVPAQTHAKVRAELVEAAAFADFVERATVIVMVHQP